MAASDIHNSAKLFEILINKQFLKTYDLVLLFSVLGVAHRDRVFAQVGPKNGDF